MDSPTDRRQAKRFFSPLQYGFQVLSFYGDIVLDILVAVDISQRAEDRWMLISTIGVLVGAVVMQCLLDVVSGRQDEGDKKGSVRLRTLGASGSVKSIDSSAAPWESEAPLRSKKPDEEGQQSQNCCIGCVRYVVDMDRTLSQKMLMNVLHIRILDETFKALRDRGKKFPRQARSSYYQVSHGRCCHYFGRPSLCSVSDCLFKMSWGASK
jgi:hypothetical protein